MDLVIKPTVRCNFKCTFCSSTSISDEKTDILDVASIKRFLDRYPETKTIIVNGGDPLMMPPSYYIEILDYVDLIQSDLVMSITTNLWPFYKNPDKWAPLFNRDNVSVITSFQYGNARLKGDLTPFSEEDFWATSNALLEECGYRPDFIAVTDYENEEFAIKTIELAKEMGVECKLNYAMSSGEVVEYKGIQMGNEGKQFILSDMYRIYVDIHDRGLMEWEYNTKQMAVKLRGEMTTCPLAKNCDQGIRTMQPSGRYYSCPALADDDIHRISFDGEMAGDKYLPISNDKDNRTMKYSCYGCPMFAICNACTKTIRDHKRLGLVEKHCRQMKEIAPDIIRINGMEGALIPTPYVNEANAIEIMEVS